MKNSESKQLPSPPRSKKTRGNYTPSKGRKTTEKSLTLQNQATDIKTMLMRYAHGEEVDERKGLYIEDADENDEDGEKFRYLDPTEQEDIIEGIKQMNLRLKQLEREYEIELNSRKKLAIAKKAQKALKQSGNAEKTG